MIKKSIDVGLLILIIFLLVYCKDNCNNLHVSEIPLIHQGDTLIYNNSTGKKDTFRVSSLKYGNYKTGSMNTCYQYLQYIIDKVNNKIQDTAGFYQISVSTSEETATYINFTRTIGIESIFSGDFDSLNIRATIGDKIYNSVNYYSTNSSNSHCKDLFFSFQYGVLSVKMNNNLIYLSEIKPER
jgi:hypothetical protein